MEGMRERNAIKMRVARQACLQNAVREMECDSRLASPTNPPQNGVLGVPKGHILNRNRRHKQQKTVNRWRKNEPGNPLFLGANTQQTIYKFMNFRQIPNLQGTKNNKTLKITEFRQIPIF